MLLESLLPGFLLPYLNTIKDFCYLFLGLGISYGFWELCERYFARRLINVNPMLFLVMVIWGASGFFFFSFLLLVLNFLSNDFGFAYSLLYSTVELVCTAVPDLDILLDVWVEQLTPNAEWTFLEHRSLIFSSVIIPSALTLINVVIPIFFKHASAQTRAIQSILYTTAIGLFIGISGHLLGDILLQLIPSKDVDITIHKLEKFSSYIWLALNISLGIFIPVFIVAKVDLSFRRNHE